eukprot:2050349-Prymnesium_polylepis.2
MATTVPIQGIADSTAGTASATAPVTLVPSAAATGIAAVSPQSSVCTIITSGPNLDARSLELVYGRTAAREAPLVRLLAQLHAVFTRPKVRIIKHVAMAAQLLVRVAEVGLLRERRGAPGELLQRPVCVECRAALGGVARIESLCSGHHLSWRKVPIGDVVLQALRRKAFHRAERTRFGNRQLRQRRGMWQRSGRQLRDGGLMTREKRLGGGIPQPT